MGVIPMKDTIIKSITAIICVAVLCITSSVAIGNYSDAVMKAAVTDSYGYCDEEIVSSDIIGMSYGSLFDATQTLVMKCADHLFEVRVTSWYDNEMSYVSQLVRTLKHMVSLG